MNSAAVSSQTDDVAPGAQGQSAPVPGDVSVRYALESGHHHSSWIVECGQATAEHLELTPGVYTLIQLTGDAGGRVRAAERLCALPAHDHLLTVQAVTGGSSEQIWCEAAQAGTLADYCAARGQLPLEQVSLIASALIAALKHLHSQQLAYSRFGASQVAFTVDGALKLLPPDVDMRRESEVRQAKFRAEDTAACASLLWLCLTGETAAAQRFRKPLHLSVPDASETLAKTLEDAIDSRSQQPTLTEIAALFELSRDPEPLELHLSAHESVLPLLPAIRPTRAPEPVRTSALGRKPKVLGRIQDMSAHRVAPKKKLTLKTGVLSGGRSRQSSRKKPVALGVGVLAFALLGAAGLVLFKGGEDSSVVAESAPISSPAVTNETSGGEQQKQEVAPVATTEVGQGSAQSAAMELTDAEVAQELAGLVEQRSSVLAGQDAGAVGAYALAGSELATADTVLLGQPGAQSLAGTSTALSRVEKIERGADETLTAVVTVVATGYTPAGSEQVLAAQGIEVGVNGEVTQRVQLTARHTGDGLKLVAAHPVTGSHP